jgi:hypothetical protein
VDGYYNITCQINTPNINIALFVVKTFNAGFNTSNVNRIAETTCTQFNLVATTAFLYANTGISFWVWQNSGSAQTISSDSTNVCFFSIVQV